MENMESMWTFCIFCCKLVFITLHVLVHRRWKSKLYIGNTACCTVRLFPLTLLNVVYLLMTSCKLIVFPLCSLIHCLPAFCGCSKQERLVLLSVPTAHPPNQPSPACLCTSFMLQACSLCQTFLCVLTVMIK